MKFLTVLLCMLWTHSAFAQDAVKNVIFIGVDDLRVELGCYGAAHMATPNIDALAAGGIRFENAYCQQAVCGPSRISLMTGLRPDSTGVFDLNTPLRKALPNCMSMPRFFKQHGYRTVSLGKIYHHHNDDHDFWDVQDPCSQPVYADKATAESIDAKQKEGRSKKLRGKELRQFAKGPAFESADVADSTYDDGAIADEAIEQIRSDDERPFFIAVGFKKPHLPFVAPKKYWDMYDPADIEIPSREEPVDMADVALTTWGELRAYADIPAKGPCSDEQTRTLIHGYRACVSYADAQIGRVLAALDSEGLRENTLIVLWSDHGWKIGDYGSWCKHTNFELDARVPLIFSGAGVPAGQTSKAMVENIDIYPTLTQWCGLETPEACEGDSLMALFADANAPWKTSALSQYPRGGGMGYSLRSGTWRYTQWRRKNGKVFARELYDHSQSDLATVNVVAAPEHQETVREMEALLAKHLESATPEEAPTH